MVQQTNFISPWDEWKARSSVPYLTGEQKRELVETQRPFTILEVKKDHGKFGERYVLLCESEGEKFRLSIPYSEWRISFFEWLQSVVPLDAVLKVTENDAYYLDKPE